MRTRSHLLKKSLMENLIVCAVLVNDCQVFMNVLLSKLCENGETDGSRNI